MQPITKTPAATSQAPAETTSKHFAVYVDADGAEHELGCESYQIAVMTLMNIESLGLGEGICVTSLPL